MKKILLLISTLGLFASSIYGQTFDYYVYEDGGSTHTLAQINYDAPPTWLDAANIRGAAFSPFDTNFTNGYLVYELINEELDVDNMPVSAGKYALNLEVPSAPELTSVITDGAYQGAPRVIAVTAGQSNIVDSRDVVIEYGLLLGQGKGDAYVEYWFKANPGASKWENIDNANVLGTKEGIVLESASGYYQSVWEAGESSFANNINTSNAQIRVTAKLGNTESNWNGEGEFGGSGGSGGAAGTAIFEIFDVNDMVGVAYWDPANPGSYTSSTDKRDTILSNAGLVSAGTYDDGMYVYPVFDFQGYEGIRDQFAPGLTGRYYSINDTNIVQVKPQANGG
tara:strand:- start:826 stop:1839 length:1014 start_codon:yes stop_codon:yes gene_type:complete